MKKIIDFLGRLKVNNERSWFIDHKSEYLDCKARFDDFVAALIDNIRQFDSYIGPLDVKDCTYRIYRDTRFSHDKTPYKTHMGAFIAPGGKKSGFSGYYFQVGPDDNGYDSGCMIATGNYYCEPRVLKLLREDIAMDDGKEFGATLTAATGFQLDSENSLKRVPRGYDADAPYSEWLKLRNFCLVKEPGAEYMLQPGLLDRLTEDFRLTHPFLTFINRAVEYSNNPE